MTEEFALKQLESMLDAMVLGRFHDALDDAAFPPSLQPVVQKMNRLCQDLQVATMFTKDIAKGNMDIDPPGRGNYLCGPAKEIHSQLISFCWSIDQLMRGNMVSKLNYPGKLYESYNALIEKVSSTFGNSDSPEWGTTVTSWRYHQILSAINQLHVMVIEVSYMGEVLFANTSAQKAFPNLRKLPYHQPEKQNGALIRYLCTYGDRAANIVTSELISHDFSFPVRAEIHDIPTDSWYKITSDLVKLTDGNLGLLHMADDITEWKRREHQLKLHSTIDSLTSAYTRKAGFLKVDELFQLRHTHTNCAAFVDLDGLKKINDTYGHTEGDFAIKTVADILLSSVRESDWVVRYGGDEFLVLFIGCTEEVAHRVIDRMYARCEAINAKIHKPYTLGFSVGLSAITADMKNVNELIKRIDQYMYENKHARNAQRKD